MRLTAAEHENSLAHYGILRKSGRYPWGSGENPHQRSTTFLQITEDLKKNHGMSDKEIADSFSTDEYPFTISDLKKARTIAVTQAKQEQIRTAQRLKDKGMGDSEIGRQMGVNESTVRSLLSPGRQEKLLILQSTADMLKRQVEEKEFLDVGSQVHRDLPLGDNPAAGIGISPDKFNTALAMLKEEGYGVHTFKKPQVGTGELTTYKVLTKPGVTQKEAWLNSDKIRLISEKSDDHGRSFTDLGIKPPLNISSKRVAVKYKEDGGGDADGVIYVRPGVPDVSLGKSRYAQVRISIDDSHFLKGMAVYKDDLPPGIDLMFNTNKSDTGNKLDAMKPLKKTPDGKIDRANPFGASLKIEGGQLFDKDGNVTSAMNIINEEGDWNKWSKRLSPQVLSKQSPDLAKSQLEWTYEKRKKEFEEIKRLTNPRVRKKLLESFADETDSSAVHLKAASLPKQANKVILPSNHVRPTEVFAPTFRNGERVALIRYPHAGTFEIPELTVNNRSKEAAKLLGGKSAPDAIVIHPKVAERLSGADFDGDAVVVIPNGRGTIKTRNALDDLKGFDPQSSYKVPLGPPSKKYPEGTPTITPSRKQQEMGNITNLISDMTVKGANTHELARAVRHSMVVIDSEKHNLDYKASARDHGILDLKRRYQGVHATGQLKGASTLITRATAEIHVPKRKDASAGPGRVRTSAGTVDVKTGKRLYENTGERKPNGELATFKSKRLAETDDAHTLVSDHGGTPIEHIYADHSNRLKKLANEARLEGINTKLIPYSPSAKKAYANEVESLNSKLDVALRNAPHERKAQAVAGAIVRERKRANPDMDRTDEKKIRGQALNAARLRIGAKKTRVQITPREWDAIQAGAISNDKLKQILNNTDMDKLRELATPRVKPVMTSVMTARAKSMLASGYTVSEVAEHLDIPLSTLQSGIVD